MGADDGENAREDTAEEKRQILRGQVESLYRNAPLGMAATVVNAALVAWVEGDVASRAGLAAWLGSVGAVTGARALDVARFHRTGGAAVPPETWARRFAVGMFLAGTAWGAVGLFVYPAESLAHQVFLAFVLGGMVAGAAGALSGTRAAFLAFTVPALTPIALRLMLAEQRLAVAMGGMVVLFGVLLTVAAERSRQTLLTSLRMRVENECLIRFLSSAKEKAEAANRELAAEVTERERAERELARHRDRLRERVKERTAELEAALAQVRLDVDRRERVERELREAKRVAEEASRGKSEFLANMSHEIRTPMNGVLGLIELVLLQDPPAPQAEYLRTARKSGRALLRILDDILDFSRIEANRLDIEETEFDLRGVVEEAAAVLAVEAHTKGLELVVHVHRGVPARVAGDPGRLRQVLVNLIGNAVKFTDRGEVVASVAPEEARETDPASRRLRFSVRDTGIGMPRDRLHLAFESFRQVDGSSTRRHGGTGLGLAISQRIVARMGGDLAAVSEPGQGSTFSFAVPFRICPSPPPPTPGTRSRPRVLVADDNASSRRALADALEELGARVTTAESGDEAERRVAEDAGREDRFRLMLIDARLGTADGFEVARRVVRSAATADLEVAVMVPVHEPGGTPKRFAERGVTRCLAKPVRFAELAGLLPGSAAPEVAPPEAGEGGAIGRAPSVGAADEDASGGAPGRILLVEDDPTSRLFFSAVLEREGWKVATAGGGREGVEAYEAGGVDLILMDVQLPELDGFAATREIRAREAGAPSRVPIVGITAHALPRDRERCLAAGMDDHLPKPVETDRLVATVRTYLERSRPGPRPPAG